MENIKDFYFKLPQNKRIVFWVALTVTVLSLLRFGLWVGMRNKKPTPKRYLKELHSRNKDARLNAIYACGVLGLKDTIPELVEILQTDPDARVKRMAAASIGRLDQDKLFEIFNSQNKQVKEIVLETLVRLDRKNVVKLFAGIAGEDKDTQLKLLEYAATLNEPEVNEKLLSLAEDTEKPLDLRLKCLELLKTKGTGEMEGRLLNLMYNDPQEEVKKLTKEVIASIRGGKKP